MSSITIGQFTLEEFKPREWRAWGTPSREEGFLPGDEFRDRQCVHFADGGPGLWRSVHDRSHSWRYQLHAYDYRRPVPLPSEDDLLRAMFDSPRSLFVNPVSGNTTKLIGTARGWLRTLLPGYEEQVNSSAVPNSSPSPVPADGWRPIETAPKDGTWVLVCDRCRCRIASNYYDHDQRDEWTTDGEGFLIQPKLWQPLPPRPQEKGGEA